MTPREFMAAWNGWSEQRKDHAELLRNIAYGSSKFNAAATAMSKEQSRSISKHKFPWQKQNSTSNKKEEVSEETKQKWLDFFNKEAKAIYDMNGNKIKDIENNGT